MADMIDAPESYNLWRYFKGQKPDHRWACELVEDKTADHGFKVADYDKNVADSVVWDQVAQHFDQPIMTKRGYSDGNRSVTEIIELSPGEDDFFHVAVRRIPKCVVGPERGAR